MVKWIILTIRCWIVQIMMIIVHIIARWKNDKRRKAKSHRCSKKSAPVFSLKKPEEYNDHVQTINQIINWLEQEPVIDKIRAEIEKEIIPRNSDQYDHEAMWQNLGLRMALKVIDKYKAEWEKSNGL